MSSNSKNPGRFSYLIIITALLSITGFATSAISADDEEISVLLLRHDSSVNSKSSTHKILNQLSLHTDLWHVAIIRGEDDKAVVHQQVLATIIRADVMASERLVRILARRTTMIGIDLINLNEKNKEINKRKAERSIVSESFTRNLRLLRAKAKVLQRMDLHDFSPNTYNLLSQYMNILRRQIGLEKVWLATTANNNDSKTFR